MTTFDVLVLAWLYGPDEVAGLRVIQPLAHLNLIVYSSFTLLYVPLASRLFARDDRQGVRELYWQSAIWVAVFSFPLFAVTATMSRSLTVTVFGERYAESASFLALLAAGHYFNAAFGFNGLTLRVFGLVRYTLVINLLAVLANIALLLLLVPRFGAMGAAAATGGTLVLHNVLKQLGLRRGTGIDVFDRRYARVYLVILLTGTLLAAVAYALDPNIAVSLALVGLGSIFVLLANRSLLDVSGTFPALLRLPLARRVLGG